MKQKAPEARRAYGHGRSLLVGLDVQAGGLIRWAGFFGGVVEGEEVGVGLDVNDAVGYDGGAINRGAEVGFADDFLVFAGSHHDEVAVFVADIDFAVGYEG